MHDEPNSVDLLKKNIVNEVPSIGVLEIFWNMNLKYPGLSQMGTYLCQTFEN